nr:MAG TPA: hypothetical protein [Caudoviricetes sp.]
MITFNDPRVFLLFGSQATFLVILTPEDICIAFYPDFCADFKWLT